MESVAKLYSLTYREAKTYLFASLFVAGNIILPQLAHLVPGGGLVWLPIYFFTLIAAYKYGLHAGLLTALLSPVANSLLFGMPMTTALPIILVKSTLLAVAAAYAAKKSGKVSLMAILVAILAYQVIGSAVEAMMTQSIYEGLQDFRLGIPGMLIQLFGGYFVLRALAKL